jgi:hypothetical protein
MDSIFPLWLSTYLWCIHIFSRKEDSENVDTHFSLLLLIKIRMGVGVLWYKLTQRLLRTESDSIGSLNIGSLNDYWGLSLTVKESHGRLYFHCQCEEGVSIFARGSRQATSLCVRLMSAVSSCLSAKERATSKQCKVPTEQDQRIDHAKAWGAIIHTPWHIRTHTHTHTHYIIFIIIYIYVYIYIYIL